MQIGSFAHKSQTALHHPSSKNAGWPLIPLHSRNIWRQNHLMLPWTLKCMLPYALSLWGLSQTRPVVDWECEDEFAGCKETCSISYALEGIAGARLNECVAACLSTVKGCRERARSDAVHSKGPRPWDKPPEPEYKAPEPIPMEKPTPQALPPPVWREPSQKYPAASKPPATPPSQQQATGGESSTAPSSAAAPSASPPSSPSPPADDWKPWTPPPEKKTKKQERPIDDWDAR